MTARIPPQCVTCARFRSPFDADDPMAAPLQTCDAYPDGIPDAIWWNTVDHREAQDGDHGLQWAPIADGVEFPEFVLEAAMAGGGTVAAAGFNINEPRIPGGEHGGEWTHLGGEVKRLFNSMHDPNAIKRAYSYHDEHTGWYTTIDA